MPAPCSVTDCDRPTRTRGWCNAHYLRSRKYGDPTMGGPLKTYWRGAVCLAGYGNFYWQSREGGSASNPYVAAHRYAYQVLRAEIPAGLHLDHMCRVTACVNPWHLEPVSAFENHRRAVMLGGLSGPDSIRFLEEYRELRARIRAAA